MCPTLLKLDRHFSCRIAWSQMNGLIAAAKNHTMFDELLSLWLQKCLVKQGKQETLVGSPFDAVSCRWLGPTGLGCITEGGKPRSYTYYGRFHDYDFSIHGGLFDLKRPREHRMPPFHTIAPHER